MDSDKQTVRTSTLLNAVGEPVASLVLDQTETALATQVQNQLTTAIDAEGTDATTTLRSFAEYVIARTHSESLGLATLELNAEDTTENVDWLDHLSRLWSTDDVATCPIPFERIAKLDDRSLDLLLRMANYHLTVLVLKT